MTALLSYLLCLVSFLPARHQALALALTLTLTQFAKTAPYSSITQHIHLLSVFSMLVPSYRILSVQ